MHGLLIIIIVFPAITKTINVICINYHHTRTVNHHVNSLLVLGCSVYQMFAQDAGTHCWSLLKRLVMCIMSC